MDSSNVDSYYLLACCLSVENKYEEALQTLAALFSVNDDAQLEHILRLNAFLCLGLRSFVVKRVLFSFVCGFWCLFMAIRSSRFVGKFIFFMVGKGVWEE